MNEETLKKINAKETINNKLNKIIETFITFYGEEERDYITNVFNSIKIIPYCKPEEMDLMIENSEIQEHEKNNLIIEKYLKSINKVKLKKIIFKDLKEHINPIDAYIEYLNGNNERKQETINLLKHFNKNVNEDNLDKLIKLNKFKEIDNIIQLYNETKKKYEKFILSTQEYKSYLNKCFELKEKLQTKYLKQFILELKLKLPKELYLEIEKEYNKIINSNNDVDEENFIYINPYLSQTSIELFNEKYNKLLEQSDNETIEYIQTERMLCFKKIGLNLGDNYLNYQNNESIKKLIPSKEYLDILTTIREKYYFQMKNEYYTSLSEYQENREEINKLELLDKDDGYDVFSYENESTMIVPNIKKVNNQYKIFSLILIYLGNDGGFLDAFIIHELNHAIETSLKEFDGKYYQMTCGWEIFSGKIEEEADLNYQEEDTKREYELFNETINELISQEITRILFESNEHIFNIKETAVIEGGTNYEHTRFLVEEFYETYKKQIIQSRRNGKIDIIYESVGKENFEELNKLFHIYYQNFPGETIYDVYEELEEGKVSKRTKIYHELEEKRNIILSNMKKYHKNIKSKKLSV